MASVVTSNTSFTGTGEEYLCEGDMVPINLANLTLEVIHWFFYSDIDYVIIQFVMPLILAFGVIVNALFIFVVARVKWMHTTTNAYLVNLAVADICFLGIGIGDKLASYWFSPIVKDVNKFGPWWCVTVYPLVRTCIFASLFLVTLVTVDKYYAVCRPIQHRMRTSPGRSYTKFIILLAWGLALTIAISTISEGSSFTSYCVFYPNGSPEGLPPVVSFCNPSGKKIRRVVHLVQTIPFFVAFMSNVVMYYLIMRRLQRRMSVGGSLPSQVRCKIRARNTVSKMLVYNGCVFFLCNFPFHVVSLLSTVSEIIHSMYWWEEMVLAVQSFVQVLLYLNSALNPIIYNMVNRKYRRSICVAINGTTKEGIQLKRRNHSLATGTTSDIKRG